MSRIEIHHFAASRRGDRARTVRVWLPDRYDRDSSARFPVLYLHDGQNVFDRGEHGVATPWGVDSILERLNREGEIDPWLVVAVDHAGVGRLAEYAPWDEPKFGIRGGAALHAQFVVDDLVPWVDRHYRSVAQPDARAVGGSSMGGLVSLWLALHHEPVFERVLALSPTVMWADHQLEREWRSHSARKVRIYLDAGARESFDAGRLRLDYARSVRSFAQHLIRVGYGPEELRVVLEPGGQHDEASWRRRLPSALTWLLARPRA